MANEYRYCRWNVANVWIRLMLIVSLNFLCAFDLRNKLQLALELYFVGYLYLRFNIFVKRWMPWEKLQFYIIFPNLSRASETTVIKELRERLRLRVFTRRHTHTFYNCNIYASKYLLCNNVEFVLHSCESLQMNVFLNRKKYWKNCWNVSMLRVSRYMKYFQTK